MLVLTRLFGTRNERLLKALRKRVQRINALEPAFEQLSDEELKGKTSAFRHRLAEGESLDALLEEAFAAVREAAKRTLRLRPYDEQLIGGMVLHMGKITEMGTGEGKTLTATLPAYLNALTAKGVHVVTVNDYLARRDAQWMLPVYEALGLTVGFNIPGMDTEQKRAAYAADITYATNSELGFDYLRDQMVYQADERVRMCPLNYAIIDEVDSILIDEARTPLIISGRLEDSSQLYIKINELAQKLDLQPTAVEEIEQETGDFTIDLKGKQVHLTERGQSRAESLFMEAGLIDAGDDLYSAQNILYLHHLNAALRAHHLYRRDTDYIVSPAGEVVIVDEHTGRIMEGRRWSEGLHQAIEAKEGVAIQNENQTLASITYQNFFKLYAKIAGMTGTADTEAQEFQEIYGLEVVVIPSHKPCIRHDAPDLIYQKAQDKYKAIMQDIKQRRLTKQPVLVGTTSIENSEILSHLLKKEGIPHQVLNAKYHEKEAHIIMEAGKPGAVTIATNMAGRGTDIVLGGSLEAELSRLPADASEAEIRQVMDEWQVRHDQVLAAGGLHVIGSERHESRRIDNQLRGRSARQGDPGSSQFYLSLEDPLLRIFASEWVAGFLQKLGLENEENLESRMLTRSIEKAQRRVEAYHFDIRKQLLEFDNIINEQRQNIYSLRDTLISISDLQSHFKHLTSVVFTGLVEAHLPLSAPEDSWDTQGLQKILHTDFALDCPVPEWLANEATLMPDAVLSRILTISDDVLKQKEAFFGPEMMRKYERAILLQMLDNKWREHLAAIDYIRQNVGLRGFAQKDPRQEFKRECFELFMGLIRDYQYDAVSAHFRFRVASEEDLQELERRRRTVLEKMHVVDASTPAAAQDDAESEDLVVRTYRRMRRNEVCYCGSGKKYKYCHGAL